VRPPLRFRNRVVVVTGASRGIGAAIAMRFAQEGARVIVGYATNEKGARKIADNCVKHGVDSVPLKVDVRSPDSVQAFFDAVTTRFGAIDVLVNNAGVLLAGTIADSRIEDWDETFAINVRGVYLCCKFGLPHLNQDGSSAIINVASRFAYTGAPNSLAYGASKAAVINITKALARQLAPKIRVNAVAPAYTLTEMTAVESETVRQIFVSDTPMARLGSPEDTAAAVAFLASSEAAFITGHALLVDGGNTI
jgi:3-oxoacyl-[acyl-carrier protein] reductase